MVSASEHDDKTPRRTFDLSLTDEDAALIYSAVGYFTTLRTALLAELEPHGMRQENADRIRRMVDVGLSLQEAIVDGRVLLALAAEVPL